MGIEHINPPELHRNPAFTQIVAVNGPGKLVHVGGQNAIDAAGAIVGTDLRTQTEQTLRNVLVALAAAGATQDHVIRLAIYLVDGHDIAQAFAAAQAVWGRHATAITVLRVVGLANPQFFVEIEATAFVAA
jgi:enamine deaminase RidA (YjgF/YER057c/UK114 family)